MIVDTHAHFTKPGARATAAVPAALGKAVAAAVPAGHSWETPEELLAQLNAAGIDKLVQVTPSIMGFDNSYSIEVAARHEDRIRVVAHLDAGRPAEMAAEVTRLRRNPLVVGIRLIVFDEDPEGVADRMAPVLDAAEGLAMPLCLYVPRAPEIVLEVATRWPGLPLVIDHAGLDVLPGTDAAHRLDGWPAVLRLADYPQVALKVSGLPEVTPPAEGPPFPTAQRLLEELVERFGSGRLLWGSNYPPVTRRCSLPQALGWVEDGCPFLTDLQREDVLGRTALSVFRLPWADEVPHSGASQHA